MQQTRQDMIFVFLLLRTQ